MRTRGEEGATGGPARGEEDEEEGRLIGVSDDEEAGVGGSTLGAREGKAEGLDPTLLLMWRIPQAFQPVGIEFSFAREEAHGDCR